MTSIKVRFIELHSELCTYGGQVNERIQYMGLARSLSVLSAARGIVMSCISRVRH